ncbi:hypothetical protein DFJ63DRAFT_319051 [Scheffersomyces coipomensis]|uniref:uncharacterized protein n=1 Tax=Scheffersomyces coipomensis TaxID=1788519 RepID=UPI00315D93B3
MTIDRSYAATPELAAGSSGGLSEESLAMFFDPDFNPSNYIDKLFQNITTSSTASNYSKNSLSQLSNSISNLTTHLDYYTNELSSQSLTLKLDTLNNSNSLIIPKELESHNNHISSSTKGNQELTRLKYYINVLNNSIISLQTDLNSINQDLNEKPTINSEANDDIINSLVTLKLIKSNLVNVLKLFEFLNNALIQSYNSLSTTITPTSVDQQHNFSVDEFQNILNNLLDTLKLQLIQTSNDPNKFNDVVSYINKLINLGSMFNNLTKFNLPFRKFINSLSSELEKYHAN